MSEQTLIGSGDAVLLASCLVEDGRIVVVAAVQSHSDSPNLGSRNDEQEVDLSSEGQHGPSLVGVLALTSTDFESFSGTKPDSRLVQVSICSDDGLMCWLELRGNVDYQMAVLSPRGVCCL
jgi:hypothetical protein